MSLTHRHNSNTSIKILSEEEMERIANEWRHLDSLLFEVRKSLAVSHYPLIAPPRPDTSDPETMTDVDAIIEYLEWQISGKEGFDALHGGASQPEDPNEAYDRAMKGI